MGKETESVIEYIGGKKYIRLYYFMPAQYFLDVLSKDRIKVSIPEECNDPLEFLPANSKIGDQGARCGSGFISFSRRYDSPLMWAHYADSHYGVCLEFLFPVSKWGYLEGQKDKPDSKRTHYVALDLEAECANQFDSIAPDGVKPEGFALEVAYCDQRPVHRPDIMGASYVAERLRSVGFSPEFYTKSTDWRYEQEWRMMICLAKAGECEDGNFFVTGLTRYLKRVVLGVRYKRTEATTWAMICQALKCNKFLNINMFERPPVRRVS